MEGFQVTKNHPSGAELRSNEVMDWKSSAPDAIEDSCLDPANLIMEAGLYFGGGKSIMTGGRLAWEMVAPKLVKSGAGKLVRKAGGKLIKGAGRAVKHAAQGSEALARRANALSDSARATGSALAYEFARNPEENAKAMEYGLDFVTGFYGDGPPSNTPAGAIGGLTRTGAEKLFEWEDKR